MKIYCCFTPAHEILLRQEFLPSIPETFSVHAESIEVAGPGDFLSPEFLQCVNQKISLIIESLRTNLGDVIVWADIDIRVFSLSPSKLVSELGQHDIAFQREGKQGRYVNTGFFVCRANERVIDFFERVGGGLVQNARANEQVVVNELLGTESTMSWTLLPLTYYARTHGWPPPKDLALYHANATIGPDGIAQKLRQFRDLDFLRRYPVLGLALTSIKFAPKRIKRLLNKRRTVGSS